MVKLLGGRAASVVIGLFMLAVSSSGSAQDLAASAGSLPAATVAAKSAAVVTSTGAVVQSQPAQSVTISLAPAIAKEAAWLYKGGWPLYALVEKFATNTRLDEQTNCLATAVYFEARGETLEGQLAVARVVMNRAASGKYPPDWCSVMKQPWQFSFVNPRSGQVPVANTDSDSWRKAVAIAQLAAANIVPSLDNDVLWYHANYVAPSWGRRLAMVQKIGAHIFYRS